MDMKALGDVLSDPIRLYVEIVKITIGHLTAQRLDVIPFSESLVAYFTRLPLLDNLVPLPQKFVLQDELRESIPIVTDLAEHLFYCVNVHHSLCLWLTNIVLFPRLIALAFGFGNVHFIIDHFESSHVDIAPVSLSTRTHGRLP
jgi:hypothetical protein